MIDRNFIYVYIYFYPAICLSGYLFIYLQSIQWYIYPSVYLCLYLCKQIGRQTDMYMGAYMRRVFVSVHFGVVSASVSISEGLCTQVWLCLHAYMNVYTYLAQRDTCSCLENKGQTRIEKLLLEGQSQLPRGTCCFKPESRNKLCKR